MRFCKDRPWKYVPCQAHVGFTHSVRTSKSSKKLTFTAENTTISPNFLVWDFFEKEQFPHSFGRCFFRSVSYIILVIWFATLYSQFCSTDGTMSNIYNGDFLPKLFLQFLKNSSIIDERLLNKAMKLT